MLGLLAWFLQPGAFRGVHSVRLWHSERPVPRAGLYGVSAQLATQQCKAHVRVRAGTLHAVLPVGIQPVRLREVPHWSGL